MPEFGVFVNVDASKNRLSIEILPEAAPKYKAEVGKLLEHVGVPTEAVIFTR